MLYCLLFSSVHTIKRSISNDGAAVGKSARLACGRSGLFINIYVVKLFTTSFYVIEAGTTRVQDVSYLDSKSLYQVESHENFSES